MVGHLMASTISVTSTVLKKKIHPLGMVLRNSASVISPILVTLASIKREATFWG
jgi:hypothetical protein